MRKIETSHIWKYQGKKSAGKWFSLQMNGGLILMVFLALLVILGMVAAAPGMEAALGERAVLWIQCLLIIGIAALLLCGALYIGRRGNSMQLSFARREDGKLYAFDYRAPAFQDYLKKIWYPSVTGSTLGSALSVLGMMWNTAQIGKQIERIDRERVIEQIMDSGRIAPYGRNIVSVKAIERKKTYCRIYCSLRNVNGTLDDTTLMLTSNYQHYEELLGYIEQLSWNSAFDRKRSVSRYEKYRPLIKVLDIVIPILCILFLAGGIVTRIANENKVYHYSKVQVQVESCESNNSLFWRSNAPKVIVEYDGEDYELQNVQQGSWFYNDGKLIDAYAANGKMYANVEGIRTTSVLGIIYFVFVFGLTFLLGALVMVKYIKKDIRMRSGEW